MTYLETIEQALLALEDLGMKHYENTGEVLYKQTVEALRQVREQAEPKCNPHPKAPHGFNRNASHSNERYTCECEGWDAYEAGYQDGLQKGFEMEQAQQAEPVALKKGECWPEDVMQMWDNYRKEIANGHTGSEPRDWF